MNNSNTIKKTKCITSTMSLIFLLAFFVLGGYAFYVGCIPSLNSFCINYTYNKGIIKNIFVSSIECKKNIEGECYQGNIYVSSITTNNLTCVINIINTNDNYLTTYKYLINKFSINDSYNFFLEHNTFKCTSDTSIESSAIIGLVLIFVGIVIIFPIFVSTLL